MTTDKKQPARRTTPTQTATGQPQPAAQQPQPAVTRRPPEQPPAATAQEQGDGDMKLRIKFRVVSATESLVTRAVRATDGGTKTDQRGQPVTETTPLWTLVLRPIHPDTDKHENKKCWRGTSPAAGELVLKDLEPEAVKGIRVGQEVYLDLTPVNPT